MPLTPDVMRALVKSAVPYDAADGYDPGVQFDEEQRMWRLAQARQELATLQRQQALRAQENQRLQASRAEMQRRMAYRFGQNSPAMQQYQASLARQERERQQRMASMQQSIEQQQRLIDQYSVTAAQRQELMRHAAQSDAQNQQFVNRLGSVDPNAIRDPQMRDTAAELQRARAAQDQAQAAYQQAAER